MSKIYFRGTREQARGLATTLVAMLVGRANDATGIAQGVFRAVGFAALSDVKEDFIRKARGGTGEDGTRWPKLSKKYLAYGRRFGRGEQAALKATAGLGKQHKFAPGNNKGLLTAAQLKRWRKLYSTTLFRLLASLPEDVAKAYAAKFAWAQLKREGARTKLEVFGNREVEILRDTSVLINSLSPGQLSVDDYTPPSSQGGEEQIFQTIANGVIVGTNVPYAATHNNGDATRGIPERRFLPKVVPDVWRERWAAFALRALEVAARRLYGGA